jgi:4-amino-4-deoxy-L-arabinose transferase
VTRPDLDRLLARPAVLQLVAAFLLVVPAGMAGLLEPTETRYAEIAREMRAGGDWLHPRLNGIAHFHKPPLAYWATAAGMSVAGENAWGARLPAALASLAALGFTVLAARRRFGALLGDATLAGWVVASTLLFHAAGRAVASDPYLLACVAGWWALAPSAWGLAVLGLGFMAKGPVVFVPTLLPVLVAAALARDRAALARLGPARGWWVFAAVALPWYLLLVARTPGLSSYLLVDQVWERFATTEHQRGGPSWYFLAVLVAGALPWTPALLAGLARALRERARPEARLLLAWLLAPLAFFSFSGSKLPAYLLPCLPAMGVLAAMGLERGGRAVRQSTGLLLLVLAGAAWIGARHGLGRLVGVDPPEAFAIPAGVWLAIAALALAAFRVPQGAPSRAALLVAVAFTAAVVGLARYDRALGSPRGIAALLREQRAPGEPVVVYARFNAGVPFHLGETVRLLEVPRETRFDEPAALARVVVTRDSVTAMTRRHPRVWLFGPERLTADLAASMRLPWTRVAGWKGEALGFVTR